jgi:hypothetical protein
MKGFQFFAKAPSFDRGEAMVSVVKQIELVAECFADP